MITTANRNSVSMLSLGALAALLTIGACAGGPSPDPWDGPAAPTEQSLMLRFDNAAETHVDVYLITQQRQVRLGRVAPGARAMLRIPLAALTTSSGFVRLAVLPDAPLTVDPAHYSQATFTVVQPAADLLSQRWTFLKTPLASAELRGAPVDLHRP